MLSLWLFFLLLFAVPVMSIITLAPTVWGSLCSPNQLCSLTTLGVGIVLFYFYSMVCSTGPKTAHIQQYFLSEQIKE